jgi:transcriptional regulator with XRE-family HTH domain
MLADKLKQLRAEKGLSQGDLAEALFVSQQAVSRWERGKGYPDILTLRKIASLFNVPLDSLIGVEEYEGAKEQKLVRPSYLFAGVIGAYVILIILCLWLSGALLDLFNSIIHDQGLSRGIGIATLVVFFASCLALVVFLILSQNERVSLIHFAEGDGLFYFLYFFVIALTNWSYNGGTDVNTWVYLLIAVLALSFVALFLFYDREAVLAQKKAGKENKLLPWEKHLLSIKSDQLKKECLLASSLGLAGVFFLCLTMGLGFYFRLSGGNGDLYFQIVFYSLLSAFFIPLLCLLYGAMGYSHWKNGDLTKKAPRRFLAAALSFFAFSCLLMGALALAGFLLHP